MVCVFSHDLVTSDDIREDKIEITIGNWYLYGGGIESCLNSVAEYFYRNRNIANEEMRFFDITHTGYLFNVPSGREYYRYRKVQIRAPSNNLIPLIAGHLNVRVSTDIRGNPCLKIDADLSLNTTRFTQYQNHYVPNDTQDPIPYRMPRSTTLVAVEEPERNRPEEGNYRLVGDNTIEGYSRNFTGNPAMWDDWVRTYFDRVINFLSAEIEAVANHFNLTMRHEEFMRLKYIEHYVDIETDNPLSYVESLIPLVERAALNTSYSNHHIEDPLIQQEFNSRGIQTNICRTVRGSWRRRAKLKIYAKTTNSVRLEIGINLRDRSPIEGGRTVDNYQRIFVIMRGLKAYSRNAMNGFREYARMQISESGESRNAYELLFAIAQSARNEAHARAISSMAVYNQQVLLSQGNNDPLRRAMQSLKRKGVFRSRPNNGSIPCYMLNYEYQDAAEFLRQSQHIPFTDQD